MKAKEIKVIESFFKTTNEHWNFYALEMLCEVLQQGQFEYPETPLQLLDLANDIFGEQNETPLKAIITFGNEVDKQNLNPSQKLFVYEWVLKYLNNTQFEGIEMDEVQNLFKSQTKRLRMEATNQKPEDKRPLVGNIRDTLKELIQGEIERLPETLKDLEPTQRLNILCKFLPYVLPRVESVHSEQGEPTRDMGTNIPGVNW